MLVDWFTIVAQIVNFLILVFLLRRFLYRPILRAMDEREAKIAAQIDEAAAAREEAEQAAETYRLKRGELEESREALLFQAKEEAEAWRKELIGKARQEVDELRARWQEGVRQEQDEFLQGLRQRVRRQVAAIARQALTELANADLEERIIAVFLQRLRDMDKAAWEAFAGGGGGEVARRPLVIRTAFALPQETRATLVQTMKAHIADDLTVQFEQAADIICGIEAKMDSHKIAWTLEDYLASLEETLFEIIQNETEKPHEREPEAADRPAG